MLISGLTSNPGMAPSTAHDEMSIEAGKCRADAFYRAGVHPELRGSTFEASMTQSVSRRVCKMCSRSTSASVYKYAPVTTEENLESLFCRDIEDERPN